MVNLISMYTHVPEDKEVKKKKRKKTGRHDGLLAGTRPHSLSPVSFVGLNCLLAATVYLGVSCAIATAQGQTNVRIRYWYIKHHLGRARTHKYTYTHVYTRHMRTPRLTNTYISCRAHTGRVPGYGTYSGGHPDTYSGWYRGTYSVGYPGTYSGEYPGKYSGGYPCTYSEWHSGTYSEINRVHTLGVPGYIL